MSITRTYKQQDGHMVHDGYFLVTPEYSLRWISLDEFFALTQPNKV